MTKRHLVVVAAMAGIAIVAVMLLRPEPAAEPPAGLIGDCFIEDGVRLCVDVRQGRYYLIEHDEYGNEVNVIPIIHPREQAQDG